VNARVASVIGVAVVLVAGIVILLASAEGPSTSDGSGVADASAEPSGDVVVADGAEPPDETELADIVEADVRTRGSSVVFRARMATDIPQRVKGGGMTWRWDVYDAGQAAWILSASLDIGPTASLTSTQTNYGSSTFDDSLPGEMSLDGDTITITLRPKDLEDWSDEFEWVLSTSLDGAQGNPRSALASDTAPDDGRGVVEGGD
jgi:hypothetical protein